MNTNPIKVTATEEKNKGLNTFHKNDFNIKEDANFVRCVDFMVKMIEKYGHEVVESEDKIA